MIVLVNSTDMDEVMPVSGNVVVLSRGSVTRRLSRGELDWATLAHAAAMKEATA